MNVQEVLVRREHARINQEATAACALRKGEGMTAKVRNTSCILEGVQFLPCSGKFHSEHIALHMSFSSKGLVKKIYGEGVRGSALEHLEMWWAKTHGPSFWSKN